jgi:G6PDH family F420-dependent oxidoreductase
MSFGTVCAPGQRYHPAIIAQAAATLAEMNPGRFWLSVGSGEALNEAITGDPWPSRRERHSRLEASVAVIRALWAGETVNTQGPVRVAGATLYDRPKVPPMIVGAALSTDTARWMGRWADAMITIAGDRGNMRAIMDAFREGGEHKPVFLQVALSYAPTREEAEQAAFDQWRQCVLTREQLADLRTPGEFDAATASATVADVIDRVRVSADIDRHAGWLREDAAMGYDRIYLHNVAREQQERFIDEVGVRVLTTW